MTTAFGSALLWGLCACACLDAQTPGQGRITRSRQQADRAVAALAGDSANVDKLEWAAQSLMLADDPEGAFPYLQRVIALDGPTTARAAFAHRLVGEVYFMRGDYVDAGRELDEALALDRISIAPRYYELILGYDSIYRRFTTYETPHLRLHFSPGSGVTDTSKFAAAREAALRPLRDVFRPPKSKKIDLFVWGSLQETGNARLPVQPSYPFASFAVAHVLASQPPGRELAHIITDRVTHPANGFAYWGIGTMFDEPGRDLKNDARRAVHAAGLWRVDIRDLWQNWRRYPDSVVRPIAAAFLAEILQRGGRERFVTLLRDPRPASADSLYGSLLQNWIDDFQREVRAYSGEPFVK